MKEHEARSMEEAAMYTPPMAVVYETETPHALRAQLGPYREADYILLPDHPRCELLYGRLPVTPAPTARHQLVAGRIFRALHEHAGRHGGFALFSPVDVVLADHSIVQPDVIYVGRERVGIIRQRIEGAPHLVVEILSPSTARRDTLEKMRLYRECGVVEYWIVDPMLETFEFLENTPDGFRVRLPEGGVYRSDSIPHLELDLEVVWRSLPS
jgi:Uma2 family endonuclease